MCFFFIRLSWRLQGTFCHGYSWRCIRAQDTIMISRIDPKDCDSSAQADYNFPRSISNAKCCNTVDSKDNMEQM